ncbi:Abi family protein [Sphingobacterium multivorum]|nr:Abi family protein [Sphingobacterium multivorum]
MINLYTFDKKLRCVFLEYLERVEVCLRTRILNAYSELKGFYWSVDPLNFLDKRDLRNNENEVLNYRAYVLDSVIIDFEKPKEQFLKAFNLKYTEETYPPENMYFETLSFGKLIKLYTCLKNDNTKNSIATAFKLPSGKTLVKWLLFLNDVRNVCAHHSRLWNRKFTANKLIFPSRKDHRIEGAIPEASNSNIYGAIIAIHHLLLTFNTNNSFIDKFETLNNGRGVRYVDKLVKVFLKDGREQFVLYHVEIQSNKGRGDLAERMFRYFYRIWDRYKVPITAIAILADESKGY